MQRLTEIKTPLPDGKLLFYRMTATEALGENFAYELDLLSEDGDIEYGPLLGQLMTVSVQASDTGIRYFNGHVVLFGLTGRNGRYFVYHASLRPWTWFLTQTTDCRVFQGRSAVDIAQFIFNEHSVAKVEPRLGRKTGRIREYCVQYRESDADFVTRLLQEEGVYTYFRHDAQRHTLVLADDPGAHDPFPEFEELINLDGRPANAPEMQGVRDWLTTDELRSGAYTIDDYDFQRSQVDLELSGSREDATALAGYELYEAPANYVQRDDGRELLRVKLEEIQSRARQFRGTSNARGLAVGHTFTLSGLPRAFENDTYLVESTEIVVVQADYEGIGETEGSSYSCTFSAQRASESWRPQRSVKRPVVEGPQTAEVVGPKDQEIHVDPYGRVKVLFHWDRERRRLGQPELSSCWVRVSHAWAGKNFGFIAIPRIGQEVIVDFLEGDPDRPIITGRVYNDQHMPPWALPEHQTRTGLVTRSTPHGDATKANELRFEDKAGHEQVLLHAQRNLDTSVEANETRDVGGDRVTHIHANDRLTVEKDRVEAVNENRSLVVDGISNRVIRSGEFEDIDYGLHTKIRGGHELTVENGGQKIDVKDGIEEKVQGSVKQEIWGGAYTQTVTGGSHTEIVSGGSANYTASEGYNYNTPLTMAISAGTSVTINTPLISLVGNTKIVGIASEAVSVAGSSFDVAGIKNEHAGWANESKGFHSEVKVAGVEAAVVKLEAAKFKNEEADLKKETAKTNLKTAVVRADKYGMYLSRSGLTVISGG